MDKKTKKDAKRNGKKIIFVSFDKYVPFQERMNLKKK